MCCVLDICIVFYTNVWCFALMGHLTLSMSDEKATNITAESIINEESGTNVKMYMTLTFLA